MRDRKLPRAPQRTTPGFAFSMIGRALNECLAERQFGQKEMAKVLEFFASDPPECVFCGSQEIKRWDHLVPINEGGETVLGNMVPACARCDDSKRDEPFEEWIISSVKGSPQSRGITDVVQRIERIEAYVQHFGYETQILEERLSRRELERLRDIQLRLQELREDVDTLIGAYRTRTGNR
jgi:hypothetical protein